MTKLLTILTPVLTMAPVFAAHASKDRTDWFEIHVRSGEEMLMEKQERDRKAQEALDRIKEGKGTKRDEERVREYQESHTENSMSPTGKCSAV